MNHFRNTLALSLILSITGSAIAADQYTITDLGTLGDAVAPAGINDEGISVGYALDLLYRYHGWVNTNGSFDQVTPMGMTAQGQMLGINDFNQSIFASYMLGMLSTSGSIYNAGMMSPLGQMMPCALNNADVVVGSRFVVSPNGLRNEQACRWETGVISTLPALNGAESSIAKGINENGWIVGSSILPGSITPTATLWLNGAAIDLGSLGGQGSQALAINSNNQVVGIAHISNNRTHAFRFDLASDGSVLSRIDLGALAGGYSIATAINDLGTAVGSSGNRAVIWENDSIDDLNTMIPDNSGWVLTKATGINESGQIVGIGALGGDPFRAFILTPNSGCLGDLNNDGTVDFFDISVLLKAFTNRDPIADLNNDGSINFFDISTFVQVFNAGCP